MRVLIHTDELKRWATTVRRFAGPEPEENYRLPLEQDHSGDTIHCSSLFLARVLEELIVRRREMGD